MSRKERLTDDKINEDKFILEVGDKKTIEYKSEGGQKGTCDYIPIKYEQPDGQETSVYVQLGGHTKPTKEDVYKNCLEGVLRNNRFRKSDRSPPYTLVVSPRDRDDPDEDEEFKKLDSLTTKLRRGVLKAVCNDRTLSRKYSSIFTSPEECKSNMLSYLCRHPKKEGSGPDTSRPKYYVVDVFANTRFDLVLEYDKNGNPIKKEIDKRKLLTKEDDDVARKIKFFGEARYPKLTSTGDRLAMKGSLGGIVICDYQEDKMSSSKVDDLAISNKEVIQSNTALEATINSLKIAPEDEEKKEERDEEKKPSPRSEGEMSSKEEHGNPDLIDTPEYSG